MKITPRKSSGGWTVGATVELDYDEIEYLVTEKNLLHLSQELHSGLEEILHEMDSEEEVWSDVDVNYREDDTLPWIPPPRTRPDVSEEL